MSQQTVYIWLSPYIWNWSYMGRLPTQMNLDTTKTGVCPGIGNLGIADLVVECDLKNNFNAMDTVVVQWSKLLTT